ncbi:MAG: LL-diaminopimelate aminotransferase [Desulfatiglandaceae bacterium]
MIRMNEHYKKLQASYLFSEIARRVRSFEENHPDRPIIRLGIGDVTRPLPGACIRALHDAVDEMADADAFRGYGPEQGYQFLRERIAQVDFKARGAGVDAEEIFISDGAKCDTGNFQELLAGDVRVAVPDPVYPVYVDTNVMGGRTGEFRDGRYEGLLYLECTAENGFIPELPNRPADLIYLCFPNNPTGAVITLPRLKQWVDYARENRSLILFDAAYAVFVKDPDVPRSIYEVEGAREVAVEFRSFSKTAGFTGLRCAYTVVPKECKVYDSRGEFVSLHSLWSRRHSTKFNGVSYPVQRAAWAAYSDEGLKQIIELRDYYMKNAALILREMTSLGYECTGGENSPYIWVRTEGDSWEFFDSLLTRAGVVCTPGSGFGRCGQGYVRISAFNDYDRVLEAMNRIKTAFS